MIGTEIKEFGHVLELEELSVVHVDLPQGKKVRPHDHIGQEILFCVVKGEVITTLDGIETHKLTPGVLLRFPGEAMIGIEAIVDSEFYVYLINRRN